MQVCLAGDGGFMKNIIGTFKHFFQQSEIGDAAVDEFKALSIYVMFNVFDITGGKIINDDDMIALFY